MTIRKRAKDGSIQTFPDEISEPAIRMAMLAYDNKDSWGAMARQVAKAVGQETEADAGWASAPAPGSRLKEAIEAVATPDMLEALKNHPRFGAVLADRGAQRSLIEYPPQIGRSSAMPRPLGLSSDPLGGSGNLQAQKVSYDGRSARARPASSGLKEWVEDELEGIGRGFTNRFVKRADRLGELLTGEPAGGGPIYPLPERPPGGFGMWLGGLAADVVNAPAAAFTDPEPHTPEGRFVTDAFGRVRRLLPRRR